MARGNEGVQPNREELLQMGIRAAKAGNRDAARITFQQILSQDKRNERAMMWMAKIAETPAERKKWLNRVLTVNPENESARRALQKIAYKRSAKENRTLLIFGVVAGVMIVLGVVVVLVLFGLPR
ncbi:MAG: hypothetical protein HXY41_00080 [Chloroflexi bacterium]|nr:hypothetical protein [Chloroflexota bacterium]